MPTTDQHTLGHLGKQTYSRANGRAIEGTVPVIRHGEPAVDIVFVSLGAPAEEVQSMAKFYHAAPATAAERDQYRAALEKIGKVSVNIEEKNGALRAWGDCARIARESLANPTQPDPLREAAPVETDDTVIEAAADLAFGHIQKHLGVTDGGTAAMFWSGEEEEQFLAQMRRYIAFERAHGEHSEKAGG